MSVPVERTIRVVAESERRTKPAHYWRQRPFEERLLQTFALHREGNELFKGGNPPFVFELRLRDVRAPR
jgi:hypothetical protein